MKKETNNNVLKANTELAKKSRELSIKEGAFANASAGFGDNYITPYALVLNANPFHIGLLSSLSGLANPFAQFFGSKLMEKMSRKKIILTFVLLQAILWLPIAFLSYLFWKGIIKDSLPYLLLILYTALTTLAGVAHPSWFSWMGDIVPENERGKYFSKRNRVIGIIGLIAILISAFILDIFKTKGLVLLGFIILFALAFTFRMFSYKIFKKQYNPKFKLEKDYYFSIFAFLKRHDNFGKFAIYQAFFNFSIMLASPFVTVFMLKELNFSYKTFMAIIISGSIFHLLATPFMGKFSDKYGNKKLLYLSNFLFVLTPLFWIFLRNPIHLIIIPQLIAGIANAAIIISVTNFTYASVSQQKRGICEAYLNIFSGAGIFLGSLIGGLLLNNFHPPNISPYVFLFILASITRFLVAILFLPKIKDEQHTKRLPPMHLNISHPFKTIHSEIGWIKRVFK